MPNQSNGLLKAAMSPRGTSWASPRRCLSTTRGKNVPIVDLVTDVVREAEIFVGGLILKRGVGTGC